MKCNFCMRVVPKKCQNVFGAIDCQKDRADRNRKKIEKLEQAALAYYDVAEDIIHEPINATDDFVAPDYNKAKKVLRELLGDG